MNKQLVDAVIKRDGLKCSYCGINTIRGKTRGNDGTVIEHMEKDRSEDLSRLCVSCRRCNSKKNSLSVYEYLGKIDAQINEITRLREIRKCVLSAIQKMEARKDEISN